MLPARLQRLGLPGQAGIAYASGHCDSRTVIVEVREVAPTRRALELRYRCDPTVIRLDDGSASYPE